MEGEPHSNSRAAGARPHLLVCALEAELGDWRDALQAEARGGYEGFWRGRVGGRGWVAIVAGVGKVAAAAATARCIAQEQPRSITVAGVCGGLDWSTGPGDLVHCTRAVQADLALRSEREVEPDPEFTEELVGAAAAAGAPSRPAWFLTADRPALSPWRRLRLARAYTAGGGGPVADMETAAVGWVARRAELPWRALRAVSDGLGVGKRASFRANFKAQAGRAAGIVLAQAENPGTSAD